jgi:hypothetical protein
LKAVSSSIVVLAGAVCAHAAATLGGRGESAALFIAAGIVALLGLFAWEKALKTEK